MVKLLWMNKIEFKYKMKIIHMKKLNQQIKKLNKKLKNGI